MGRRKITLEIDEWTHDLYEPFDLDSLVVAHFAVNEGKSYEDIQTLTGFSRATVARRLQHAKDRGWLIEKPSLNVPPALAEQFRQRTQDTRLQSKLVDRLRNFGLRRATVVSDVTSGRDEYEVPRRVGQAAAARLEQALANREGCIGINWGHAVRRTIESLPRQQKKHEGLTFVPIMGNLSVDEQEEKQFEEAWRCSSNRLVRLAAEAFGAKPPMRLTTPAFISKKFLRQDTKLGVIWELINEDFSYTHIFGRGHHRPDLITPARSSTNGERPLIKVMDTVVSGMSALEPQSALIRIANLINDRDLEILKDNGYVGDLGGRPIFDESLGEPSEGARRIADSVSDLVISILPTDLERIAREAREDKRGHDKGVFLTGIGKPKAKAFLAAIKRGVVNELITDRSTCREMLVLLGDEPD